MIVRENGGYSVYEDKRAAAHCKPLAQFFGPGCKRRALGRLADFQKANGKPNVASVR